MLCSAPWRKQTDKADAVLRVEAGEVRQPLSQAVGRIACFEPTVL